jgi:Tfp pilus assembly protein PilX
MAGRGQGGFALPLVMVFAMLSMLVGWGLYTLALAEGRSLLRENATRQAFYVAEAGVENARAYLSEPGRDDWSSAPAALYTDKTMTLLADASYTVRLSNQQRDRVRIVSVGTYKDQGRQVEAELQRGN